MAAPAFLSSNRAPLYNLERVSIGTLQIGQLQYVARVGWEKCNFMCTWVSKHHPIGIAIIAFSQNRVFPNAIYSHNCNLEYSCQRKYPDMGLEGNKKESKAEKYLST